MDNLDWLECAQKFMVGTHPGRPDLYNRIYIEAVYQLDQSILWAVRLEGLSALTKPEFADDSKLHFLIESDFRGEERKFIRFSTKEEAYEAYLKWKAQET